MTITNHVISLLSLVVLVAFVIFLLNVDAQPEPPIPLPQTELTLDEQADLAVVETAEYFKFGTIAVVVLTGCCLLRRQR